jgi:hypothetical protein
VIEVIAVPESAGNDCAMCEPVIDLVSMRVKRPVGLAQVTISRTITRLCPGHLIELAEACDKYVTSVRRAEKEARRTPRGTL